MSMQTSDDVNVMDVTVAYNQLASGYVLPLSVCSLCICSCTSRREMVLKRGLRGPLPFPSVPCLCVNRLFLSHSEILIHCTHSAVKSFFARIMPKLMFTPMSVINGSLETTVVYMVQAAEWISNLLLTAAKQQIALTPFQFDLCFAVGEPMTMDVMVDDDADDDDDDDTGAPDDEKDNDYVDYIGNIGDKLKNNKLKTSKQQIKGRNATRIGRVFDDLYKQFLEENPEDNPRDKYSYLQSKRIISMVDRRHQNENPEQADDVFMYEPPADAQIIPKNAPPEWFVASSRQCLLPGLDVCSLYIPRTASNHKFKSVFPIKCGNICCFQYGSKGTDNDGDDEKNDGKVQKEPSKYKDIGVDFAAKSSVLTFSFHVKTEDVIKLYLYHNGQCMRFMPEDIKNILPLLYNMKYGNGMNEKWLGRTKEVDSYIDRMKRCLKDIEFDAFQQSYM